MTYHLGIDSIEGFSVPATGLIQAIGTTDAELTAVLTARGLTPAQYTTSSNTKRRVTIDETDTDKWTNDCEPGWYLVNGAVQIAKPPTPADTLAADIAQLKAIFEEEEGESFRELLVRAYVDPQTDSGHDWLDDMVNGWIKPWLRLAVVGIEADKARATPTRAYGPVLAAIQRQVVAPGLLGFWSSAIKAEWRPLRDGTVAWEYDTADGGTKAGTNQAVTYPQGESVATWSSRAAIEAL